MLNWRENGSHVEKAFNLGEPPLVPLSPYPPLISLIIPPKAGRLWRFLMNPLCPVSVHQDWQARYTLAKWAGNNQSTIRRRSSPVRDSAGEGRGENWRLSAARDRETNRQMTRNNVSSLCRCCVFFSAGASKWHCIIALLSTYCNYTNPGDIAAPSFNLDSCGVILHRSSSFNTGAQPIKCRFFIPLWDAVRAAEMILR